MREWQNRKRAIASRRAAAFIAAAALALLGNMASADANSNRDIMPDTWVAVDGLGRQIPNAYSTQMGQSGVRTLATRKPHRDKAVAIFYFLTMDDLGTIYDNTKILSSHPDALDTMEPKIWGPLYSTHYWGEPLFGYYSSCDEWVLRKHAEMLSNAGVDVIVIDNSNGVTYDPARETLLKVWEQIRREGGQTPQVAFLCPFGNPNGIGTDTLNRLYESVYAPGRYADLWFRWRGKPLILADPSYADASELRKPIESYAQPLTKSTTLGMRFTADRAFERVGGVFATWATSGSAMTLTLREKGPGGRVLARQRFGNVIDNAAALLNLSAPCPKGVYYLEMSQPTGPVGWWGTSAYSLGSAYASGAQLCGDRSIEICYCGSRVPEMLPTSAESLSAAQAADRARAMLSCFTFRSPITRYDVEDPAPGAWAWLQIYPQTPQVGPDGKIEEVSVGVAQNYNSKANGTAPMSVNGAFGRGYHNGYEDHSTQATRAGANFDEQWRRALEVDPPLVFVTGWNEWTASFYDTWAGFHGPPPIFVDEFNEEFSRDIEPMIGGHEDAYYYQLVSNIRRYKGARSLPPITRRTITIDGNFDDWATVGPDYRDNIGDPVHRNSPGSGDNTSYQNSTGRNDIIAAKVAYDSRYIYFYVRTHDPLSRDRSGDWMTLYLDTDSNPKTGWLGYDYLIDGYSAHGTALLRRNEHNRYEWRTSARVSYAAGRDRIEIRVPLVALGIHKLPATVDFKWTDHCYKRGDWTDFILNGDAAPDDRFNYRAVLPSGVRQTERQRR